MLAISEDYQLSIRQGPVRARVAGVKEKGMLLTAIHSIGPIVTLRLRVLVDRKPVDPPPIIQLKIKDDSDPAQNYLQSPYYFMCCNLYDAGQDHPTQVAPQTALAGTLVSSLHRLKDVDNSDGGFFVFGDLSVKVEGEYRLRFSLFEMRKAEVFHIKSIVSDPFTVFAAKNFPGMSESTFLSRSFGDQGVRLRIRKEPRTLVKRPAPPGLRPETYPHPYAPRYPTDPRTPTGVMAHAQHGTYMTASEREQTSTPGDPSTKRSRTSVDFGPNDPYARDPRFWDRLYPDQQPPYSAYPPQQQPQPMFAINQAQGPHSAPAGMPAYSFRQPNLDSSATSSPYTSPGSQLTGRIPSTTVPSHQQETRYPQYSYHLSQQGTPTHLTMSHQTEPVHSMHQQQSQAYQSNYPPAPPLQHPNPLPILATGPSRTAHGQSAYQSYPTLAISPGGVMAPPPFGHEQGQPFNLLPPLQTSTTLNQSSFAVTGSSSYPALAGSGQAPQPHVGKRYGPVPGPPTSFDTAAQR